MTAAPRTDPAHAAPLAESAAADAYARLERACGELDAPFALVDLDAFWANAADLLRRAAGKPIRVASKSLRCRALLHAVHARDPGFRGTLAFTLPEALWLAERGFEDLVVAYPTADRGALRELAGRRPDAAITLMVDSVEHLDFFDAAVGPDRPDLRVCIDVDAGWHPLGGRIQIGAKRSPLRNPDQV